MEWHPADDRPVALYRSLRAAGRRPALLESLGPLTHFGRRILLGADPASLAEVRGGRLFVDGTERGDALELFDLMAREVDGDAIAAPPAAAAAGRPRPSLFPCWIGFLSYEFARHVALPANDPMPGLPEASFRLYPHGWLWEDGILVESPEPDATTGTPAAGRLPAIEIVSDYPPDEFLDGVLEVQERIRSGWVYQVNLSHRFHFDARGVDPLVCYERLRAANPSPFFGLLEGDEWAVVSGSPERLFDMKPAVGGPGDDGGTEQGRPFRGDADPSDPVWRLTARPIAGTRRRGAAPAEDDALEADMRADRKERAEHVMLVDLLRNDLSRVCEVGSVEVSEAFTVERYSHVMHLVSEVVGTRRADARLRDAVAAIFPGGTITGAPKESVMNEIARLEPVARGAYTGAMGYVSGGGVDLNILIRSFTFTGLERETGDPGCVRAGTGFLSGGGGIVIESDPEREYLETRHKVEALLHILGHGKEGEAPAAPRPIDSWRPPRPRHHCGGARVVFLENHDSYSYNIVNYLRMLGAEAEVIDHLTGPDEAAAVAALGAATHVIVGPGPGDPWTSGRTLEWVATVLERRLPFLGVCLGHQALGVHCGARLIRAPRPVHGEDHLMSHKGRGVLAGIPDPAPFTRYNSLILEALPDSLTVEAWSAGEQGGGALVMAVAHRERPAWGVQFPSREHAQPARARPAGELPHAMTGRRALTQA